FYASVIFYMHPFLATIYKYFGYKSVDSLIEPTMNDFFILHTFPSKHFVFLLHILYINFFLVAIRCTIGIFSNSLLFYHKPKLSYKLSLKQITLLWLKDGIH